MKLPPVLAEKAASFPEVSYGATKVTLLLAGGREIKNVTLAWGQEIIGIKDQKVVSESELGFGIDEILDVKPDQ
ncbi:MAG: hypothetical protein WD823_06865 [Sulfuricaulis sp.]|uniref:hypothetical protein n=1 Tax=Sulfuricaulis sp. TaxID=2003553 RepID=UPI0034A25523